MGVLVQPPTPAGIDRRHPAGRSRRKVLSATCSTRCGTCFTLTKQPPRFPVRFKTAIPAGAGLPQPSVTVAVSVDVSVPLARIDVGEATKVFTLRLLMSIPYSTVADWPGSLLLALAVTLMVCGTVPAGAVNAASLPASVVLLPVTPSDQVTV